MVNFKCIHILRFIVIINLVPLLINVMSSDIYNELVKYSSVRMRLAMMTIALIAFGVVTCVSVEPVHHSRRNISVLPLTRHSSEPERNVQLTRQPGESLVIPPALATSVGPQVTGRPFIDPQIRIMVNCYATSSANERWGVDETVEFMTARIHTKYPVPDVEAAMHSILTLTGSKVLLRRLEIGPEAGNSEIDQLSLEISEAMTLAREIDQDCTLQLGSFAICKYTDQGLKWWRLQKPWIPTISCVSKSWNLLDFLKGQNTKWSVRGSNLQSATLKVSTTKESEILNVLHQYKTKNGEDVLVCWEPRLVVHATPKFQKEVYIYALNSVEAEEGVTFDVQSNPTDVPGPYWISVVQILRNRPWTMIMVEWTLACTLLCTSFLLLVLTHKGYNGITPIATSISSLYHHFQHNANIINVGNAPEENSILSLFLYEFSFYFLAFTSLVLLSIINTLQERRLQPMKDQPLAEDDLLEDTPKSPSSLTAPSLEEHFPEEFDNVPGLQTTSSTNDFSSNPNPRLHNKTDVNSKRQEEIEGCDDTDNASTSTLSGFKMDSPFDVDYESIEKDKNIGNLSTHDLVCYGQSCETKSSLDKLVRLFGTGKNPEVPERLVRDVLEFSLSANERQIPARFTVLNRHRLPWRSNKIRLLEKDVGEGVVVIRLLGKEVLPVVHLQTIKCLADLADYSQNQEKIASFPGVLDSLMSHLQEEDSPLVQEHTARCLANLAQTQENRVKMASASVLDPLVKLLANDAVPQVHEQAARCLTNLAATKDIKERIANYPGLLDALVIQLQKHRNSRVQRRTMECLTNLASSQEVQLKIVSDYSVVLDALVHLLGEKRTSDVQLQSLKCLISLSNHYRGNQVAIASHSGVLDALLRFLRYNWITTNRINVQVEAARCLLRLLEARENLLKIASHVGLFDTLGRCLEPSRRIHEVQNSAVKCFTLLAAAPENPFKIVSFPGIVSAMVNRIVQVENSTGQELAAWCLNELAKPRETKVPLTSHPGLLKSLVAVLNDLNSPVLEPAAKCLLKFARSDEPDVQVRINSHGASIIDTLVRVLGRNWDVSLLEGKEDTANRLSNLVLACRNAGVLDFSDLRLLGKNMDVSILMHVAECLSYFAQLPAIQSKIASYPGVYNALRRLAVDDNNSRAQNQAELCLNLKSSTDLAERDGRMTSGEWTGLQGRRFQCGDDWFEDPITCDIMCDPVKCSDGVTYDRWTIINNGIERSPYNRTLTKFCIVCDDIDVRRRLFHTFPLQEIRFRTLRDSFREKALKSARDLDFEDAVEKLNHVLTWAPADTKCRNELDNILELLGEPSSSLDK